MESLIRYLAPPHPCGYLAHQVWRLEYEHFSALTAAEYQARMLSGWRHFGHTLFRPRCPACSACLSLRIPTARYRPNRSQLRARQKNEDRLHLEIGSPEVTRGKLRLYDRYHAFQADAKGWPQHPAKDPDSYIESFVFNPFPVEEWRYYAGRKLVGVGYVDALPAGLSAIYFFYDPDERPYSPGTWNVVRMLQEAQVRGLPHVYLGYYVAGCGSLEYKALFRPNEVLRADGTWGPFRN